MANWSFKKKITVDQDSVSAVTPKEEHADNSNNQNPLSVNGNVQVLGGGCAKCKQLEESTVAALKALEMDSTVEHVRDYAQIAAYGVMSTPALVVDGKVVSFGKVLSKDEVIRCIRTVRG